jgi:alginate O-acetyltransferase complex protein AlgJ
LRRRHVFEMVVFMAVCAAPLALSICGVSDSSSTLELKRTSATLPSPPRTAVQIAMFPSRMGAYVNNHFGGRSQLIQLNSLTRLALGGSGSPDVTVGRNGWLFLQRDSDVLDKHRGLRTFPEAKLERWVQEYERRRLWLADRGIGMVFVVIPNKHSVYAEHVPRRYSRTGLTPTDQLTKALRDHGVPNIVDLRHVLRLEKGRDLVYWKTDTHWTDRGAFVGYQKIIDALLPEFPTTHRLAKSDLAYSELTAGGDLSRLLGLRNVVTETVLAARVTNSSVVAVEGEGFRKGGLSVRTTRQASPAALVFCDSFVGGVCGKYLQESFSRTLFVDHRKMHFDPTVIENMSPDVVIYAVVERLIPFQLKQPELVAASTGSK